MNEWYMYMLYVLFSFVKEVDKCIYTVQSRYLTVISLQITHEKHTWLTHYGAIWVSFTSSKSGRRYTCEIVVLCTQYCTILYRDISRVYSIRRMFKFLGEEIVNDKIFIIDLPRHMSKSFGTLWIDPMRWIFVTLVLYSNYYHGIDIKWLQCYQIER